MIERRNWHWVDWMLLSVQTGWFLLGVIYALLDPSVFGGVPVWAGLGLMLAGSIGALAFWRPCYVNYFWLPIVILLTVGSLQLLIAASSGKATGIVFVPLILVGFLSHRRTIWWTVPVFVFGFPLANQFVFHAHENWIHAFEDFLNYLMFFSMGFALGRMHRTQMKTGRLLEENQRQYTLIRQQNKALEQYAGRIEELTLQAERNRMARELHDTVGHTFTSVIMGMDAISYLIETSPEKAKEQLEKLRTVTRNGLEEVRRSIHQMAPQDDGRLVSEQLSRLANEFAVQTGTQIRVETVGVEGEVPQQVRWTLMRCLQESLTNAKRHGEASVVNVTLTFEPLHIELRVEDDGIGADKLETGFGLTAMKERLQALQGTLSVSSEAGQGTVVVCRIPMAAAAGHEAAKAAAAAAANPEPE
jgi:signal transduction histidine kinase